MCEIIKGSYVTTVVVHKSYFKNICRSMLGRYTGTQASQINEYVEGLTYIYILTACVCTCVCTTAHEGSCFHTNTRVHGGRASGRIDEGPYSLFMLYTPHHTCNTHNISQRTALLGSQTIHALFVTLKGNHQCTR